MTDTPVSTIDLDAAATASWDAVVVGAGLAGSIAARGLARAGHRVLLVERTGFPRSKVCGCCLSSLATRTLEDIGLGELLDDCGARPLEEVHLFAGPRPARVPIKGVYGLSRETLDARLAAAAVDSGAELLLHVRALVEDDGSVTLVAEGRSITVTASAVILASGLRSHEKLEPARRDRSLVGVGALVPDPQHRHPEGVVGMVIDRDGYVGIAPLEDGRLTIASAVRAKALKASSGSGDVVKRILEKADLDWLVQDTTRFTGVPALHRHRVAVQEDRLLAVGDAAGFVEPITGEGMSWAIATGAAVVPSATALIRRGPAAADWANVYRRLMRRRHLRCSLVGSCIGRPRLVRTAVLASSLMPVLRAPVLSGLLGRFDPSIKGGIA